MTAFKIVTPVLKDSNNDKEFYVISFIIYLKRGQFFRSESDGIKVFLRQLNNVYIRLR